MDILYKQTKFVYNNVLQDVVEVEYEENVVNDDWARCWDKENKPLFVNDIVQYNDDRYVVRFCDGCYMLEAYSTRLAWYDRVVLNHRTARQCKYISNVWQEEVKYGSTEKNTEEKTEE